MANLDQIKALLKSGDVAEAETLCRKALEAAPDDAAPQSRPLVSQPEPARRSARIKRLGPFEIVKDLAAKGAQGKFYVGKALEPCFDGLAEGALVALKVMEIHDDDDGERAFRRLQIRTNALVAAATPGVVRYYGCFDASDESSDRHVIVMELLNGQTLEERLEQNPQGLDADEALRVITTCAEALVRVAEFGLVHRDINPSNIFLCDDGGIKLIDFEEAYLKWGVVDNSRMMSISRAVDCMAPDFHPDFRPEKGFRGDECSDVFSLTVCLYEMLAGTRPYAVGGMRGEQSMMAYFGRWTKVSGTDVTKSLKIEGYKIHALAHVQKVIKKGLSPDRAGRYQTYREFREALRAVKVRELDSPGGARYALLRCVGKGGFGVVFRARRVSDGLVVAIKYLLRTEYAERFAREARALARFNDDRIVSFVEYFAITRAVDETHFIVMQFLDGMPGSSLRDRITTMNSREKGGGRIPFREIVVAFRRFAGGLKALHDGGIIHRNIKPANLYMPAGAPERACVMDSGASKTDEAQTTGMLPGTLDYMPPEMALGQSHGTPAGDIYLLGLCLYEALTGQPLFPRQERGGDGFAEFYRRAREVAPPDLSRLNALPTWQSLVRDMTANDVSRRIGDCAEVERRLDAIPAEELSVEPQQGPESEPEPPNPVPKSEEPEPYVLYGGPQYRDPEPLGELYGGPVYNSNLYKPIRVPLPKRGGDDHIHGESPKPKPTHRPDSGSGNRHGEFWQLVLRVVLTAIVMALVRSCRSWESRIRATDRNSIPHYHYEYTHP